MIRRIVLAVFFLLLPLAVLAQGPVSKNTPASENTPVGENGDKTGVDDSISSKQEIPENESDAVNGMAENGMIPADGVIIGVLDKVTARVNSLTIANNDYRRLGDVVVRPRACQKSDPLEAPESAAFLEIWQFDTNHTPQWIFSGWMFASSPAISSMNHPVYDIWVVDCADDVPPFIGPRRPFPKGDG